MKLFAKIGGIVKDTVSKMKTVTSALSVCTLGLLGVGAQAAGEVQKGFSPIEKSADGTIAFTPMNVMEPITDGLLSAYSAWAIVVVIIIVVGLMMWIFKKK